MAVVKPGCSFERLRNSFGGLTWKRANKFAPPINANARACHALDAAIYAENPSREEVERLTRELAEAQAESLKLRTDVEFRIRQTLTPE